MIPKMKIGHLLLPRFAIFALTAITMSNVVQSLVLPNPMKCVKDYEGKQQCIIPKMDASSITDFSLQQMIPEETEDLTIFCTSTEVNSLSESALQRLLLLRKLMFWNCIFEHFPAESLQAVSNLTSLTFHTSTVDSNMDDLNSTKNRIRNYSAGLLCSLPLLTDLAITGYRIRWINETLPCSTSKCCQRILMLNLTGNYLDIIEKTMFKGLESMKILDLTNNQIKHLPRDVFRRMKALKKVILTGNDLQTLSIQLFKVNPQLTDVEFLHGDGPDFQTVPSYWTVYNREVEISYRQCSIYTGLNSTNLDFLTKLRSLDMCVPFKKYLNENVVRSCTNLRHLSLQYVSSQISGPSYPLSTDTPPFVELVLREIINLTKLSLEYDGMILYPNMFKNLGNLRHLAIHGLLPSYNLSADVFSGLQKLQFLKISCSKRIFTREHFWDPHVLQRVPQIKVLHVYFCLFSLSLENAHNLEIYGQKHVKHLFNVPVYLCNRHGSASLGKIYLQFNRILYLRQNDFQMCTNLSVLDLSNNAIRSFYDDSIVDASAETLNATTSPFFPLKNLADLVLHHNGITEFDFFLIPKYLINLDLRFNGISFLTDVNNVGHSLQLQVLKLSSNQIIYYAPSTFPPSLRQICMGRDSEDKYNKRVPSISIDLESFTNLKNLDVVLLKHEKEVKLTGIIKPSKQNTYFHVQRWCKDSKIHQLCPVYLNTIKSQTQYFISEFHIIPYYDNSTTQHLYCKYFNKYTCFGNDCGAQTRPNDINGSSVKVMDCSKTQFQEFPREFPKDLLVDHLFLDGNNFSTIPSFSLMTLNQTIKVLFLNNSQINVIDDFAFAGQGGLQEVHLEDNYIVNIPENMMPRSPLQFLYLQNNRIVQVGDLRRFLIHSLQELHLENNRLRKLPKVCPAVGESGEIDLSQEIYLQNNYIKTIYMGDLATCSNPNVFILRNNSIKTVESDHSRFNLMGSGAIRITPQTAELKILDLSANNIREVSESFKSAVTGVLYGRIGIIGDVTQLSAKGILVPVLSIFNLNLSKNSIKRVEPLASEHLQRLRRLYLNDNLLTELHGEEFVTVTNKTDLKILSLANNNIHSMHKGTFRHMVKLQILDLSRNKIATLNATIFDRLIHLKRLFLAFNELKVLRTEFDHLLELEELLLNDNLLSSLKMVTFQNLRQLKILHLHNNKLVSPEVWKLPTSIKILTLFNNLLICDCQFMPTFLKWLNTIRQENARSIQVNSCVLHEQRIPLPDVDNSLCHISYESILGGCLGVLTFLFLVVCILYYKRLEIQVRLYSRYGVRIFYQKEEIEKRYDVFVAYSSEDEEFVVNDLLEGLRDYRVCIHFKDFPPGAYITESIAEAVENSCRTLLVFTPRFLSSPWCKYEFKMAHNKTLLDKCCRLILLLIEDVDENRLDQEQKAYLRTNTYIKWNDTLFWEKLKFALPNARGEIPESKHRMLFELSE